MNVKHLLLLITIAFTFASCGVSLPSHNATVTNKIDLAPGTEDLVLDESVEGQPRLIVSCSQRRKGETKYGGFMTLNLTDNSVAELPMYELPEGLIISPHGIDLAYNNKGIPFLYVVNHHHITDSKKTVNSILVFQVKTDRLVFVKQYTSKFLVSPNDVAALPDGSFYASNDSKKKRVGLGWAFEKIFKMRSSKIAYCDAEGNWSFTGHKRLAYANGIQAFENRVIVAATQKKDLAIFNRNPETGALTLEKNIKVAGGLDNITMVGDNQVLIASHPSFGEFIKHAKNAEKPSSGIVHLVNLTTGEVTDVYANDGTAISANSVAYYYKGTIYIGQVFEGFVLVVKLEKPIELQ